MNRWDSKLYLLLVGNKDAIKFEKILSFKRKKSFLKNSLLYFPKKISDYKKI